MEVKILSLEDIFEEFEEKKEEKKPEEKIEHKPEEKAEEKTVEVPNKEKVEEKAAEVPSKEKAETEFFEEKKEEKVMEVEEAKTTVVTSTPEEEKFDTSEDKGMGKDVYMIYGLKGEGKTVLAFSFPGNIACLSFDRKSLPVKQKMFKDDARIKVYDAIKYMDSASPEVHLEGSEKTFRYLHVLLDHIAKTFQPDWIVIDGSEIFQQICEMTMRYRNNLMPFQGVSNLNLWKERRMYIRQIHNKALSIAKKGIIYTAYTDKDEIIEDGEFVAKKDVPKWIDAIMYETDCVIKVEAKRDKSGQKYYATVESSKTGLPSGVRKDVTDIGIKAFFQGGEEKVENSN